MNDIFKENLNRIKGRLHKKDRDYLMIIDGEEGSGKSVLALQVCTFMDPTFNLSRVCFTAEDFKKQIINAPQNSAVLHDEGAQGLNVRSSLSKLNKMLVGLIQQMRQKNLFVVVVIPTIFYLDRYIAYWRASSLLHIHLGKDDYHQFYAFNTAMKKKLLLYGKKEMDYATTIHKNKLSINNYYFSNCYANIDEEEYRAKKFKAFQDFDLEFDTEESKAMNQRNQMIYYILNQEYKLGSYKIAELFEKYNIELKRSGVERVILHFKKQNKKKEVVENNG